jgi:hypothetical protein
MRGFFKAATRYFASKLRLNLPDSKVGPYSL